MPDNNQHTPGPWNRPLDSFYGGTLVATGRGDMAIDCAKSGDSKDEDRANARLISAAPDYYAAVEYWLDQIYDGEPLKDWQVQLVEAHRKAKGE